MATAKAMFGAGCFWGIEATFQAVPGVIDVAAGYSGGTVNNPTYQQVCTDTTGHAEVVEVTYDPDQVAYETLLETLWACHDPTQVDRQGPDIGHQYRSVIYTYDVTQNSAAAAAKQALGESGRFTRPIATEITPAGPFWRAEDYHQRYFEKRGVVACPTH